MQSINTFLSWFPFHMNRKTKTGDNLHLKMSVKPLNESLRNYYAFSFVQLKIGEWENDELRNRRFPRFIV